MHRWIIRHLLPLFALGAMSLPAAVCAANLTIPQGHPRLWYSAQSGTPGAARLTRARNFVRTNPLPINNWDPGTRGRDLALRSLLSGNAADCNEGIAWIRNYNFPSQNDARWTGEQAILIFDWCYPHIGAADRTAIINRWNTRLAYWNAESWGGVTMAASNYYWGFLRNSLLWGIASFHHNPSAQNFINHALDVRYRSMSSPPLANGSRFNNWYQAFGVGGVPLEGSAYGAAMIHYPAIAFTSATDYGYDAWNLIPFHRDALFYLDYAAPSQPTMLRDGAAARYEFFPFNEDENFKEGGTAEFDDFGDYLAAMALRNPGARSSRLAKSWMDKRGIVPSWWMRSELASATITTAMPTLPLDYYADGAQFLYGRGSTAAGAAHFMLQVGSSGDGESGGGVGHSHHDLGNFQIWRKGRWMTRETTGYVDSIAGWNNGPAVEVREGIAHNTVLFEGRGQISGRRDWPKVLRLQSTSAFAYTAVDMTNSYRAPATETWLAKRDWPFAEVAIREFIYLRGLESLVVLDRLRSGSDSLDPIYDAEYTGPQMAGTQVRKTFVLHATGQGGSGTVNPFALGTASATATVGTQRLDLRTLLPAAPRYRVITEGGTVGQFRLEYDVSGAETSYFLNVVSVRDGTQTPVAATLVDTGSAWQLTLSHSQKGTATVVLQKGLTSTGGSVRIGQSAAQALRSGMQGMLVTHDGPRWLGSIGVSTGGNLPAVPSSGTTGASTASLPPSPSGSGAASVQGGSNAANTGAATNGRFSLMRLASALVSWFTERLERLLDWNDPPSNHADSSARYAHQPVSVVRSTEAPPPSTSIAVQADATAPVSAAAAAGSCSTTPADSGAADAAASKAADGASERAACREPAVPAHATGTASKSDARSIAASDSTHGGKGATAVP